MPQFDIEYINARGETVRKTQQAQSVGEAVLSVKANGVTIVNAREKRGGWLEKLNSPLRGSRQLGTQDLASLSEQLSELLEGGIALDAALGIVGRSQGHGGVKDLAASALDGVKGGLQLSQAIADGEQVPKFFVAMVMASETSGSLVECMQNLSRYYARRHQIRGELIASLLYPVIVLLATVTALLFILVFVIPEIAPMVQDDAHALPWLSKCVFWASDFITGNVNALAVFTICVVASTFYLSHYSLRFRKWIRRAAQNLPFVAMFNDLEVANMFLIVGMLLKSGVEISTALRQAKYAVRAEVLQSGLEEAIREIRGGGSFLKVMHRLDLLPDSILPIVSAGENTGNLGSAVYRAGKALESSTNRRINRFLTLINPLAIVFLGGILALLMSGVFLSIFSMNQIVAH